MQLSFGEDTFWKFISTFLVHCNWNSVRRQFNKVLAKFRYNATWFLSWYSFKMSQNNFRTTQFFFGYDTNWKCLKMVSIGCNWKSSRTHVENVLEYFKKGAIDFRLRQLKMSDNILGTMQLKLSYDTFWKGLRTLLIRCNSISLKSNLKTSQNIFNRMQLKFA